MPFSKKENSHYSGESRRFEGLEKENELVKKYGIAVNPETYSVPFFDDQGNKAGESHFMKWEKIPHVHTDRDGKKHEMEIPIEDCVKATKEYGWQIHTGEMTLLEAVEKLKRQADNAKDPI